MANAVRGDYLFEPRATACASRSYGLRRRRLLHGGLLRQAHRAGRLTRWTPTRTRTATQIVNFAGADGGGAEPAFGRTIAWRRRHANYSSCYSAKQMGAHALHRGARRSPPTRRSRRRRCAVVRVRAALPAPAARWPAWRGSRAFWQQRPQRREVAAAFALGPRIGNFKRSGLKSLESPTQPWWAADACLDGLELAPGPLPCLDSARPGRFRPSRSLGLDLGVDPVFSAIQSARGRSATSHWRQAAQPFCVYGVRDGRRGSGSFSLAAPRARPLGGGCGSSPRWVRIFSITGRSRMAVMILSSPAPQLGAVLHVDVEHALGSRAQAIPVRSVRPVRVSLGLDHAFAGGNGCGGPFLHLGPLRHHQGPQFALGASTPWNLMRCRRGWGTSAASRYMNSSGLKTRCVVPSRHGVFSFSSTCPAA